MPGSPFSRLLVVSSMNMSPSTLFKRSIAETPFLPSSGISDTEPLNFLIDSNLRGFKPSIETTPPFLSATATSLNEIPYLLRISWDRMLRILARP